MIALHSSTETPSRDATSAVVIFGLASQILGGSGAGFALRVERQNTNGLTAGLEFSGGKGSEGDDANQRHWLASLRGYGRYTHPKAEWAMATFGLGVSTMDTGLIAIAPHAGIATGYTNSYAIPTLQLSLAASLPLRRGAPEIGGEAPDNTYFGIADVGVLFPFGEARNAISLNLGAALSLGDDGDFAQLSAAYGRR
jgi:hypothetical protein